MKNSDDIRYNIVRSIVTNLRELVSDFSILTHQAISVRDINNFSKKKRQTYNT